MPRAQRVQPLHRQISDWFAERIAEGAPGFLPGDKLPPIRETARTWDVAFQAAQHAYELLASARLVESRGKSGTFVSQPRNILGPQQRMRSAHFPSAESVTVRAAELIDAPAYIRPILVLPRAASRVIRREWVTSDSTGPFMLSVSWLPARFAQAVPELLAAEPLPDPQGAAHLIAGRTGAALNSPGRASQEARQVRDDGREARLLELPHGGHVLAVTYVWMAGEDVLEYGEFIVRENRVVEFELEP
jgi:DNA-binding GntR family transcriptional regulator